MGLLEVAAAVLVVLGIAGILLPAVPGTPLIFLGALLYDYGSGWSVFGGVWLGLLFVLMLISVGADLWLGTFGAKRGGASWRAILAGLILGLVGLVLAPPFGFVIGSIAGVVGMELLILQDGRRALQAGTGWVIGWLIGIVTEGTISVLMVLIILWQVMR